MTIPTTQRVSTGIVTSYAVDREALAADLDVMERFPYTDTYGEFVCGGWKSCAVYNGTARGLDASLDPYDGSALVTDLGRQLPYVRRLVEGMFRMSALKYGRIARLTPGSALVPHRDYLELDSDLVRVHLPLRTHESCVNSHDTTIYHMDVGEVWFLDATSTHSAISGWSKDRVHLVLDFHARSVAECFREAVNDPMIPRSRVRQRRPVEQLELDAFAESGVLMTMANVRDYFRIAIKALFDRALSPDDVFSLFEAAVARSGSAELGELVAPMRTYFLLARSV